MTANAWHRREFVCYDVESTGVSVDLDRIVTATIARIIPGQPTEARSWLINPGVPIPAGATAVHGITDERVQTQGHDPAEAIRQIVDSLAWTTRQGIPVVAFNAPFDFTMLDRECRRHNIPNPEDAADATLFVIDPFVLDKQLDKWRKGSRTLTATCQHYQVALNGAHDATQDALAAGRVAWRMAERWPRELQIPLSELHEKQARWRDAWAVEFQTYLRTKKGETDALVNGEWPVQSLPPGWDPAAVPDAVAVAS
jgi:DNA polymerase-3 subunit epsilon